ncbi:hypothetical protein [Megalodesulfovibrio paquesii]
MDKLQKEALQVTKEIVVKFIETGRVSPANLGEVFPAIYTKILETITAGSAPASSASPGTPGTPQIASDPRPRS